MEVVHEYWKTIFRLALRKCLEVFNLWGDQVFEVLRYELSVQLQYEQYYAEIEGKLPIFEQKWSDLIHILEISSDIDEM